MIAVKDRTSIYKKHQNKWITLSDDEKVISDGKTLDEALDKAIKKGYINPSVIRVPDLNYDYLL